MQPKFQGIDNVYKSKADNKDIRDLLEQLVPQAKAQMTEFSKQFKGRTEQETCKKIFDYLKNNFTYLADGNEQVIKLPSALLKKKIGDCKSYSLFTSSILENLSIPYHFVYASYNSNPIPGHVYVTTNNGCIIDAVYGIFNEEKKPIYKYKKNMNVRYMAGLGCDCNNNQIGKITIISREKRDRFGNFIRETVDDAGDIARKAAENAKRIADEAAKRAREAANKAKDNFIPGLKTGSLAPGRALFLIIIKNNFDGFASRLANENTTPLLNAWKRLGGDRTILAKNLKEGASKPAKKLGFIPKLNSIFENAKINGIGEVDEEARKMAEEAVLKFAMTGDTKALIAGLCTATGAAVGTALGPPHGTLVGAAGGVALNGVIIGLTPVIVNAVRRTPKSNAPITIPGPIPAESTNTIISEEIKTEKNSTLKKSILPIAAILLVGGGIYLSTRKK